MHGLQVQLLISDSDVENYKQIKADLDVLRLLVEKSELWVFKKKGDSRKERSKDEEDESAAPAAKPSLEVCFTLFVIVTLCYVKYEYRIVRIKLYFIAVV